MPVIDISTNVGKVRYKVGDIGDFPILPDSVYENALLDSDDNISKSSIICAQYILAKLAFSSHERLAVIEIYGNQIFDQYKKFLELTVMNPSFSTVCPIPYAAGSNVEHPLIKFQRDFKNNYVEGTQSREMSFQANLDPYPDDPAVIVSSVIHPLLGY